MIILNAKAIKPCEFCRQRKLLEAKSDIIQHTYQLHEEACWCYSHRKCSFFLVLFFLLTHSLSLSKAIFFYFKILLDVYTIIIMASETIAGQTASVLREISTEAKNVSAIVEKLVKKVEDGELNTAKVSWVIP